MTVREYYTQHSRGAELVTLCDFGLEGNRLEIRNFSNRLDLVDDGCRDTGTDSSDRDVIEAVNEWLDCVEAGHLHATVSEDLPVRWLDPAI